MAYDGADVSLSRPGGWGASVAKVNKRAVGQLGERIASAFLTLKGYEVLRTNLRYAGREVDILARDGDALVAVEVKLRRGRRYGKAAEAVDARKLGRIRLALEGIVAAWDTPLKPRIDVVAIDFSDDMASMVVEHLIGV
jgi:putative endonuclease